MKTGFPGYADPVEGLGYALGLGYDSSMLHEARRKDDAAAFMHFAEGVGGLQCKTLDDASLLLYCARAGAVNCLEALIKAGATDQKYTIAELRERAESEIAARDLLAA